MTELLVDLFSPLLFFNLYQKKTLFFFRLWNRGIWSGELEYYDDTRLLEADQPGCERSY